MNEIGWHWRTSCAINACLGGDSSEPLCSRAWRCAWRRFNDAMQIAWRDPVHCEDVHIRWLAGQGRLLASQVSTEILYATSGVDVSA